MSHETFELIDRLRQAGSRAAMATLVRTSGTTPRKEGTKMFVGQDGGIFGSVTIGGCVDARVIERSAEVLGTSGPQLLNMQLGDEEAWEIGLTCGGAVDVFVEPLTDSVMQFYEAARVEWQAGRPVALVSVISGDAMGSRLLIGADGSMQGTAPAALKETLSREVPRLLRGSAGSRTVAYGSDEVYIEVLRPPSSLVIFGASAVAIPLVTYARTLGFRTVIIDGRARFATRERFPEVDDIRVGIASEIADQLTLGPSTPVVLVVHDYKIDVPVLKKALDSDTPYIGLLGSRRRGAAILQMLRDDGVGEEQLARVRVPIGLDLGGESAAEIALSIIAEVVAVIRGRNGMALSARPLPQTGEVMLQRS
jgi:xanthine dehydrogenase accessory factor